MQTKQRSVWIHGIKTSVFLEDAYFDHLRLMAGERGESVAATATAIYEEWADGKHRGQGGNLSRAIRLAVLDDLTGKLDASQRELAAATMAKRKPRPKPEPVNAALTEVKDLPEPLPVPAQARPAPMPEPYIRPKDAVTDDGRIIRHRREFNPAAIAKGFAVGRTAESSRHRINQRLRIDGGGLTTERRGHAE